jgi:hypothetical protein
MRTPERLDENRVRDGCLKKGTFRNGRQCNVFLYTVQGDTEAHLGKVDRKNAKCDAAASLSENPQH